MKTIRSFIFTICLIAASTQVSLAASTGKDQNIATINQARQLYGKGKIEESLRVYSQIPKTSEFWVEATEEKAWAYVRLNQFDKALAELKSILNPVFLPFVGPEAIMLAAFIDLKTCNYKGVFEKIALYKKEMLPRVESLELISSQPNSEIVKKWTDKMKAGPVSVSDVGQDVTKLPRFFYRDAKAIKDSKRAKILAKKDLEEISKNLKKMKIIEIEVVQRSFAFDESLTKSKLKFGKVDRDNEMTFPADKDSNEVWLDEIGNYEVKTQVCATSGVKK
jgi:hypothetical protein